MGIAVYRSKKVLLLFGFRIPGAQWLRMLTALAEDLSLVSSTHIGQPFT